MTLVRKLQKKIEVEFKEEVETLEKNILLQLNEKNINKNIDKHNNEEEKVTIEKIKNKLTDFTVEKGEYVSTSWKNLFPVLLTTYRDGYEILDTTSTTIKFQRFFYPKWWLEKVGYFDIKGNKEGILFASNPKNNVENLNDFKDINNNNNNNKYNNNDNNNNDNNKEKSKNDRNFFMYSSNLFFLTLLILTTNFITSVIFYRKGMIELNKKNREKYCLRNDDDDDESYDSKDFDIEEKKYLIH
jgi:hypothetical protein